MSQTKNVEDLEPGELFSHEDISFVCVCVTRGPMNVTNLHAIRLEDYRSGRTDRDYLFTSLKPLSMLVGEAVFREHIVINIS